MWEITVFHYKPDSILTFKTMYALLEQKKKGKRLNPYACQDIWYLCDYRSSL